MLHVGWYRLLLPDVDPVITRRSDDADKGLHAFVIAGYDERGFWVHNSFGPEWGTEGFAILPYADWADSFGDVWVVEAEFAEPVPAASSHTTAEVMSYRDLWQHLVVLRDDGRLRVHRAVRDGREVAGYTALPVPGADRWLGTPEARDHRRRGCTPDGRHHRQIPSPSRSFHGRGHLSAVRRLGDVVVVRPGGRPAPLGHTSGRRIEWAR